MSVLWSAFWQKIDKKWPLILVHLSASDKCMIVCFPCAIKLRTFPQQETMGPPKFLPQDPVQAN
jgi:hypothetical protein